MHLQGTQRGELLLFVCAECIDLIESKSAPLRLAVMQGTHGRLGERSGLRMLDPEILRHLILLRD